ncbi:MAG TPA: 4a-hydroxytetrahydrobiopterin dehydratase [Solirubrobacteraceae bacterium]|nr:4a-hydroxytetrahydrobiopterin dehydratase [Solirubrobacteraceae bacterium]
MTDGTLSDETIATALTGTGFTHEDTCLVRTVELADFAAVIAAVNRIAEVAEARNHHPDLLVHGWNKLTITLSTHSAGGITEADLDLAGRLAELL